MLRFLTGINPILTYLRLSVACLLIGGIFLLSTLGLLFLGIQWNLSGDRGWNGVIAVFLQFFGLLSGALLPNYAIAGFLGYLRGQPGGEKGLSINDGLNTATDWIAAVKNGWVAVCFWISMPWLVLFLIDFRGIENALILILILSIPALFGSILIYPDSKVFRNVIYWVYVVILVVAIAVGIYNTAWRSTTSEEGQKATSAERTLDKKFNQNEREVLKKVEEKAANFELKEGETREELKKRFIASLGKSEAALYRKSLEMAQGESETARAKKGVEVGKESFAGIKEYLFGKEVRVLYTLTSLTAPQQFCGLGANEVYTTYEVVNPKMLLKNRESGRLSEVNLNSGGTVDTSNGRLPYGGASKAWMLVLNGTLPGSSDPVQADEQGCVSPVVNVNTIIGSAFEIAEPNGEYPVKIRLKKDGGWTWSGLITLLIILALGFLFIRLLTKVWGKLRAKK